MRTVNVALVQADLYWHDPVANRALFDHLIDDVDADLIVLPEMLSTGFTMASGGRGRNHGRRHGGVAARPRREEGGDGRRAAWSSKTPATATTRLVWMPPDGRETVYDKRHLFRMAGEHEHYAAGDSRVNVPTRRLADTTLRVLRPCASPVWLRSRGDYDALLCVANWPAARQTAWNTLLRARAVENLCYTIGGQSRRPGRQTASTTGVARGSTDPKAMRWPTSFDREAVVAVSLDLDELDAYRQRFPAWRDADGFENRGLDMHDEARTAVFAAALALFAGCSDAPDEPPHPGQAVYERYCYACHQAGIAGAPALNDAPSMGTATLRKGARRSTPTSSRA